jgi:hypothetical protein
VNIKKEQNPRPQYIKEYYSNRINNNVYIPYDMTNEKTGWGIIVRAKNKYVLKLFTTGKGKKTGRVCSFYKDEERTIFLKELNMPKPPKANIKNRTLLCSYIANILLSKNKLVIYPLYKPKL